VGKHIKSNESITIFKEKLELDCKPSGEPPPGCSTDAQFAHMHRQPENIMPLAPSIGWEKA